LSRGPILRSLYGPVTRTSKYIATLLAALALVLQCVAAPCALAQETGPRISARAWSLTDAESGEYLAGEYASERLPMGSTDKIMVALVALKQAEAGRPASQTRSPSRRTPLPSRLPSTATSDCSLATP
jgi:D-alanyl-D-alanine carboxypeptidase